MPAKLNRYLLSPLAERDLEDIWRYTEEMWSTEQAEIYHQSLVATFVSLASGKKKGRISDVREGYFKYAVGGHMVYFKQTKMGISIIRILHQSMDVSRHLQ